MTPAGPLQLGLVQDHAERRHFQLINLPNANHGHRAQGGGV